jgi:DNA-binding MarR family transcriptional regulator
MNGKDKIKLIGSICSKVINNEKPISKKDLEILLVLLNSKKYSNNSNKLFSINQNRLAEELDNQQPNISLSLKRLVNSEILLKDNNQYRVVI